MTFSTSDFIKAISGLSHEQCLHFYELFSHNLTVVMRGIWSDNSISSDEKVDRMKLVNEIIHCVTAKLWTLRLKTHEWSEMDSCSDIAHFADLNPGIIGDIVVALKLSFNAVTFGHDDSNERLGDQ